MMLDMADARDGLGQRNIWEFILAEAGPAEQASTRGRREACPCVSRYIMGISAHGVWSLLAEYSLMGLFERVAGRR